MRRVLLVLAVLGPVSLACHTITEELPSRPSAIKSIAGGTPPGLVRVPVPAVRPVPSPVASATPRPTPTATPTATPAPGEPPGGENRNPVARVACSVYFVECNGEPVPGSHNASSAPVGCR